MTTDFINHTKRINKYFLRNLFKINKISSIYNYAVLLCILICIGGFGELQHGIKYVYADESLNYNHIIKTRLINNLANTETKKHKNHIKAIVHANKKVLCTNKLTCNSTLLFEFYKEHDFNAVWIKNGVVSNNGNILISLLLNSYHDGLNPKEYRVKIIKQNLSHLNDDDITNDNRSRLLANIDMLLTDAFFIYTNDLYNGYKVSPKMYPFWQDLRKPVNFIDLLNKVLLAKNDVNDNSDNTTDSIDDDKNKTNTVWSLINDLSPKYPMYTALKNKLIEYQNVQASLRKNQADSEYVGWGLIPEDSVMKLGSEGEDVVLLKRRLFISGELSKLTKSKVFDKSIQMAVIQYQQNNALFNDGIVATETIKSLNIPIEDRIKQIEFNMDKLRLFPRDMPSDYIIVNLPDYSLNVIKDQQTVLFMDVAVGDSKHPSCILNSQISYLVFNPYWNIPSGIALNEVLPEIKTDPSVFNKMKLEVLKYTAKDTYTLIDPLKVDWQNITDKEFKKYRFRQLPGSDNALGKIKFMFPNNCEIYLHDSNKQDVFDLYRRDFSHGCIRVGEPFNLAEYILNTQKGWTDEDIVAKLESKQTKIINLPKPLNLYIIYLTANVSPDDWLQFNNDIYNLDKQQFNLYP